MVSVAGGGAPRSTSRRKRNQRNRYLITFAAIAAGLWTAIIAYWTHSILAEHGSKAAERHVEDAPEGKFLWIWPDDYQHKDFLLSLTNCDPNSDGGDVCKQRLPEGSTTEQVGLLRPPGMFGNMFDMFVKEVVRLHASETNDLLLIPTSHIERQHGFTKIIRFTVLPLLLAAADVARSTVSGKAHVDEVKMDDLKNVVRQLVRWHCQLSRLADSTALLTISLEEMAEDPWEMESKVLEFLSLTPLDANKFVLDEKHVDEDEMSSSLEEMLSACSAFMASIDRDDTSSSEEFEAMVDEIIDDEMKKQQIGKCQPIMDVPESHSTLVVGHFLGNDPSLSAKICAEEPLLTICAERSDPVSAQTLRRSE